jgi:cell division protein FtsL
MKLPKIGTPSIYLKLTEKVASKKTLIPSLKKTISTKASQITRIESQTMEVSTETEILMMLNENGLKLRETRSC